MAKCLWFIIWATDHANYSIFYSVVQTKSDICQSVLRDTDDSFSSSSLREDVSNESGSARTRVRNNKHIASVTDSFIVRPQYSYSSTVKHCCKVNRPSIDNTDKTRIIKIPHYIHTSNTIAMCEYYNQWCSSEASIMPIQPLKWIIISWDAKAIYIKLLQHWLVALEWCPFTLLTSW